MTGASRAGAAVKALALFLVLGVAASARAESPQPEVTGANLAPYPIGGNAEPLPFGGWRLWIDASDPQGAGDVASATAMLEAVEGPRWVPMDGPVVLGKAARFEVRAPGEPGLRWNAVVVRDQAGAEALVQIPRAPVLAGEPGVAVTSAGPAALASGGAVGFLGLLALLAATPWALQLVDRWRLR